MALTAILLQENDCFILDEPFNGIDIQSSLLLVEIIRKLKSLNKVVLISSHIFSTLTDTCDAIHYLKKGQPVTTYLPSAFQDLEQEMREVVIGRRIERLELR